MIDRLCEWFEEHRELRPLRRVVAAVSGGVDSMVLMDLLSRIRDRFGFSVVVCHVDHRLREESAEEQRFVEAEAKGRGLDFAGITVDVKERVERTGESSQMAARVLRYEALARCAREQGADAVALAHHADDQAETVLLRIIRGTTPAGLAAMAEVRKAMGLWWIRPLLRARKEELRAYAAARGVPFREDPSNRSMKYLRNKIRLELLPLLEERYQPQIKEKLCQLAAVAREEEELLQKLAEDAWRSCVVCASQSCAVDLERFSALPVALQRRVLTLILYYPSGRAPEWSASHIEAIRRLALTGRTGSQLDLGGGWQARRGYGELVITWNGRGGSPEERECGPAGEVPLVIPGSTLCPSLGVTIDATFVSPCEKEVWETSEVGKASGVKPSTPGVVYFDWGKMEGRPLFIRTRRPGDRFEPFGLGGTKKLKEVWIDDKVPRHLRDRWPLVTDGSHILWIVGWRRSGFWPLDEDTEVALRLEVTWWDSEIRGWLDRRFGVGK